MSLPSLGGRGLPCAARRREPAAPAGAVGGGVATGSPRAWGAGERTGWRLSWCWWEQGRSWANTRDTRPRSGRPHPPILATHRHPQAHAAWASPTNTLAPGHDSFRWVFGDTSVERSRLWNNWHTLGRVWGASCWQRFRPCTCFEGAGGGDGVSWRDALRSFYLNNTKPMTNRK